MSGHKNNKMGSGNPAVRLPISMNNPVFPMTRHLSITELQTRPFIDRQKEIEQKGPLEEAARTRQHRCNIMREAAHQELIVHNPVAIS